ncbi:hypothetical protein QO001_005049 [Methylobacterium brachiatum]|uniref:Uncharacterized protein n=1 Tax=Methylobacterium brachiatum TaxID=269660 RepID=A0AAJ1WYP0_9HYPH|nr:hypothetical protein [Methylobacterium brachiatum]MCB4805155.1 hypothetical protein [Methylobacterium brachiatum]MDQ0546100.1 hypothetical protein [Methylobacterium brachiatum]
MDRLVTDDASSVLSPIGYDTEAKRIYLVIVSLYNWQEFGCSLISRRVDTGEEAEFTSGLATKSFLTGTDRAAVLDVILAATDNLICWTQPHTFKRITSDANLTAAAIAKHEAIGRVFTRNGYRVIAEQGFHGQRVWRVSRS